MVTPRYTFMHSIHFIFSLIYFRYEFYETDEKLSITVFDRGADPANVHVNFDPRVVCVFYISPSLVKFRLNIFIDKVRARSSLTCSPPAKG